MAAVTPSMARALNVIVAHGFALVARPGEVIPTAASPVVSNATMRALEQRGYRFREVETKALSAPRFAARRFGFDFGPRARA